MTRPRTMFRLSPRVLLLLIALLPRIADAAPAPTLFRIFLTDGTDAVSYGEYARVGNDVVFSMPVGGTLDEPRLHLVTLPAGAVDWPRTERYSEAARADHYATSRGEGDFLQLSNDVARVLNDIALSTDRSRALALAEQARTALAQWPDAHYHYRENDVRDILSIVDNAIVGLRGQAQAPFALALVASTDLSREPLLGVPAARTQLDQVLHVAKLAPHAVDRMALLQDALSLLNETAPILSPADVPALRSTIEGQIRHETEVDQRYAALSERLLARARRAASAARAADVEREIGRLAAEDARLGRERPETVDVLRAELQAQLDAARRLRLLRDQLVVRRAAYQDYQRRVGMQLMQLVKARPLLESIRRLDGPAPDRLVALKARLSGGAERLQRLEVPPELKSTHDLLVGAWRFAETAASGRYDAVTSGSVSTAWTASSAAAGALLLLSRAQDEIRTLLEIPRLQ